jgi:adenosine deaminase
MSEEVSNIVESFGLGVKDILSITKNTIDAGFVGQELKSKALEKLS